MKKKKSILERLNKHTRINCSTGCHEWTSSKNQKGYGLITIEGRPKRAHRIAYEVLVGSIPVGMFVCHHCDNPSCINPEHLFLGTAGDNNADMIRKGRMSDRKKDKHPNAKLNIQTVREVRSLIGAMSRMEIARRYAPLLGVSVSTIRAALNGQNWS